MAGNRSKRFSIVKKPPPAEAEPLFGKLKPKGDKVIRDNVTGREYLLSKGTYGEKREERPLPEVLVEILNDLDL